MIAFLLPILSRYWMHIVGGIALAIFLAWAGYKVNHWCNTACEDATARAVQAEGLIKEAQERATAIALLWSEAIQKVEVRYVEKAASNTLVFGSIRERAKRVGPSSSGTIRLAPDARRVLDDASAAANAGHPAPAKVDNGPAQAVPAAAGDGETFITPQEFAVAWADAAAAYADVYYKWEAAVRAYQALQQQETKQ
jgi:hypothetical protein